MRKFALYDVTWASNVPSDDIIVILIEETMSLCRITVVFRVFVYFNRDTATMRKRCALSCTLNRRHIDL